MKNQGEIMNSPCAAAAQGAKHVKVETNGARSSVENEGRPLGEPAFRSRFQITSSGFLKTGGRERPLRKVQK
jgi:hypothetical protein